MILPYNKKLIVLFDQMLFSGIGFLTTIFIARILSVDDFGMYAGFVLGIYLLVSVISAFVIQPFQVCFGFLNNKKTYHSFVFWLHISISFLILLMAFIGIPFFFTPVPITFFGFGFGFVFHDFARKYFLTLDKPYSLIVIDILFAVAFLSLLYLFSLQENRDLSLMIGFLSFAYLIPFLFFVLSEKPLLFDRNIFKMAAVFHGTQGKWLFLTSVSQWWSGNLFVVASGAYLGSAALGGLRLAQSLMGVLNVVLQAIENYILPQTALRLKKSPADGLLYLASFTKNISVFFLIVLILIFMFASNIIEIAGGVAYLPFAFVLKGLVLLYALVFLSQPIRLLLRAHLLNKQFFNGYVFSLLFSLVFSNYLLSNFGLSGVIIGLSVSQIILILYWSYILKNNHIYLWKSYISS